MTGFTLAHVTRRGEVDSRFDPIWTGFGRGTKAQLEALLVDRGGRPLLVGGISSPLLPGHLGLAMARYGPSR
jgi:hypothetical protein